MSDKWIITMALVVMLPQCISAQEDDPAKLSQSFKDRALASMKHSDVKKRKSAYRTFQYLGAKSLKDYDALLRTAQRYHQASMRNAMRVRANPYIELTMESEALANERARVMKLIHTDWKKDAGKIRMLQNEMEGLDRKYGKTLKLARANSASIDEKMTTAMLSLVEIQWELVSIERQSNNENTSDIPDEIELEGLVIQDIYEAEEWVERRKLKKQVLAQASRLDAAAKHNAGSKWASVSQKKFSDHLNGQRAIIGLQSSVVRRAPQCSRHGSFQRYENPGLFLPHITSEGET